MVRDALIVLKAHCLAGRPTGDWAPLATYEVWDRIIRGAVWFAGAGDCCATRRQAADEAPDRKKKIALLEGWTELPDGTTGGVTANRAVELVALAPESYPTLRNALMEYSRNGKPATGRTIGNILRGMKGNPIDGKMFVVAGEEHKTTLWVVQKGPLSESDTDTPSSGSTEDERGIYGSGGSSFTQPRRVQKTMTVVRAKNDDSCQSKITWDGLKTHPLDPPDPPTTVDEATAWCARRAGEIRAADAGVPAPEVGRRAWLELKARLDAAAAPPACGPGE